MKPSKETIETYRKIYFDEFKDDISEEEAYEGFLRVVNYTRAMANIFQTSDISLMDDSEFDHIDEDDKL